MRRANEITMFAIVDKKAKEKLLFFIYCSWMESVCVHTRELSFLSSSIIIHFGLWRHRKSIMSSFLATK